MTIRSLIFPLLALCAGVYFGYSLEYGDHGLRARHDLQARKEALQGELAGLTAVHNRLSRDVALLRPDSLDPDMLDERARAILNLARPDEIVMLKKPQQQNGFLPLSER